MKTKNIKVSAIIIGCLLLIFSILCFIGINNAYNSVFSRCEIAEGHRYIPYEYNEIDSLEYPRKSFNIYSGTNKLDCFLYTATNAKGLIIISCGHRCSAISYLQNIIFFIDKGWNVISYDYTGYLKSEGENMVGYQQSADDLHAMLQYIDTTAQFDNLPIMLYGHSLGAYASTAVLQYNHPRINSVVAASGFSDPVEQWDYSVYRNTGFMGSILAPFARLVAYFHYGNRAHFSAVDGINSTSIPILIIQGTTDEYYGNVSSTYQHRNLITNPNCIYKVMDDSLRHGHYDYFSSERAIKYRQLVHNNPSMTKDKTIYYEMDSTLFNNIDRFFSRSIK